VLLNFFNVSMSLFSSMQGDILFLHMSKDPIRTGEIVVFNVDVGSYFCISLSLKLHVNKTN
jgi:hypothetical protein